jgi:hypothetical protein
MDLDRSPQRRPLEKDGAASTSASFGTARVSRRVHAILTIASIVVVDAASEDALRRRQSGGGSFRGDGLPEN